MFPEDTDNAPLLTERQTDSMNLALAGVFGSWVLKMRHRWGACAEDKLKILEDDRRQKRDLLSIAPRLLRPDASPADADLDVLVTNVRRKEYSVSDLFVQLCCLEEAMEESLDGSRAGGPAEVGALIDWVRRRFRDVFQQVLDETTTVYESFVETGRALCLMDLSGSILYANEKMCHLLGVDCAKGLHLPEFFGNDAATVLDAVRGAHGQKPLIRELSIAGRSSAGVRLHSEIMPLFMDGHNRGAYATFTDVTFLTDLQRRVFDQSPVGILRVNRDLEFTYLNPAVREMIGADTAESPSIWQVVRDEQSRQILKEQFSQRKEGKSDEYEIEVRRVDDNRAVPVRIAATPEYDNLGNMIGALSIVRSLELEKATQAFHTHIESCRDWKKLLGAVAGEIARIIPHDLLILSVYTRNRQQARVIFEYPEQSRIHWPKRWFAMSQETLALMRNLDTRPVGDLEAELARPEMEQFRNLKEVELLRERGIRSFIRIPVSRAEESSATIMLMSGRPNAFAEAGKKLDALPIGEVVNTALYYRMLKEQQFRFDLMKRISDSKRAEDVMDVIVRSLAKHYGWPDVAIFRVDDAAQQCVLEAQAHAYAGARYDKSLTLGLGEGVLGEVYRSGKAVNIGDVSKHPAYRRTRKKTKSELCIPIRLQEKIRWLLNVEDKVENAFSCEEEETLQRIVDEARSILGHLFMHFFLDEFIAKASEAIFVTDMAGLVLRSNEAAAKMLGSAGVGDLVGRRFEEFVAEEDRYIVSCGGKHLQDHCRLIAAENRPVDVLLSCEMHKEFGCRVFCAKDLSLLRRVEELEATREMFREVAGQTRIPFSLLFTWLRRLRGGTEDAKVSDLLEKAIRQLRKAELTYEQFVLYDVKKGAIPFNPVRLDMGTVLTAVKEELPHSDSEKIVVDASSSLPEFRGDLFQLVFVFQAILAYLLRFVPLEEEISVKIGATASGLQVCIRGFEPAQNMETGSRYSDRLPQARAEVDIALGETIIRRFIEENHRGSYARKSTPEGKVEFLIRLPIIDRED